MAGLANIDCKSQYIYAIGMYSADCDENITIQATAISLSLQQLSAATENFSLF